MRDNPRLLVLLGTVVLQAGCAGSQSALDPAGPSASSIHRLGMVMYVGATLVTLLVTVLILMPFLLRRERRANHNLFLWGGGVALPGLTLTALVHYVLSVGREMRTPTLSNHLTVDVTGHVYWWEMSSRRPGGLAAVTSANELRLPDGEPVEVFLQSADVIHSFWVPNLAGKTDMIPGRVTRMVIQADRPGVYRGQCAEYCGAQHALMAFDVIAVSRVEFDTWLAGTGLRGMPRRVYTYDGTLGLSWLNLISTVAAFVLAAGVLVFLIDFIRHLRRGHEAGDNPWDAPSLEWLSSNLPVGFRSLPIIDSRYPMWDHKDLKHRVMEGRGHLPDAPTAARESLVTTPITGEPEQIIRLPGPSWIPFIAALAAAKTLAVRLNDGGTRLLMGDRVFLNVGTHATIPEIPGLVAAKPLTHIEVLELDRLPEHLMVLGGGYVSLEFAQAYRRFGSRVTVVEHGPQLAGREDPDVADAILQVFRAEGIEVLLSTETLRVQGRSGERVSLRVRTPHGEQTLDGSDLLVAMGRTPNTAGIGLDVAGVELDARGYITVNDRLETTAPEVWAMGECAGSAHFTHVSFDDFRVIRDNLAGGHRTTRDRLIPFCLFTDPPLARVGLNERAARRHGVEVRVATLPMRAVLRTRTIAETQGFMKALVEAQSDCILGFTMLGPEAGEVMAVVQTAMLAGMPYTGLRDAILTHPTMAEGLASLVANVPPQATPSRAHA